MTQDKTGKQRLQFMAEAAARQTAVAERVLANPDVKARVEVAKSVSGAVKPVKRPVSVR